MARCIALTAALLLACSTGCSRTPLNEPDLVTVPEASDADVDAGSVLNTEFFLELGSYHTCTVRLDNSLYCWGGNEMGQLGDGTKQSRPVPVRIGLPEGAITSLATGFRHTCAALVTGDLYCWGENVSGQLGVPGAPSIVASPSRVDLPSAGLGGIISVAAGEDHTCAVLADGRLYCWGSNKQGQLGVQADGPTQVPLPGSARQVAAGDFHTCALVDVAGQRRVYCWGQNFYGQLGDGTTIDRSTPVQALVGVDVLAIRSRGFFNLALPQDVDAQGRTRLIGWGENQGSQLGSLPSSVPVPQEIEPLWSIPDFSAGLMHTCVVRWLQDAPRAGFCWGTNGQGQLGDGTKVQRAVPTVVLGLPEAAHVSAGLLHSCAIAVDGSVWCWGTNDKGQIGDGTTTQRLQATRVQGM